MIHRRPVLFLALLFLALGLVLIGHIPTLAQSSSTITRVSVASDGTESDRLSWFPALSGEGRYTAFASDATNLVPDDTNNVGDIFVHDRVSGQTIRVSVATDGTQANRGAYEPEISADGRYISFQSEATNLVPGDTNSRADVFLHDRLLGQTVRVSVASNGTQGNSESHYPDISSDGRYVAFGSYANNWVPGTIYGNVFIYDRVTEQTTIVSLAPGGVLANSFSDRPAISSDGRYVAFESLASNLVPGDTNNHSDIFIHDRRTGETERVSIASNGTQTNNQSLPAALSDDGRYVAFESLASNLVPGDTNNREDVFIHDRGTGQTRRVSVASDGSQGNNLSRLHDLSTSGRYVAIASAASNLVPDDTNNVWDVFIHHVETGQTIRVSTAPDGAQTNAGSFGIVFSPDEQFVAYWSGATNLVPNDTNDDWDIFVDDGPNSGTPTPTPTVSPSPTLTSIPVTATPTATLSPTPTATPTTTSYTLYLPLVLR